jgi:hypothetical protein
MRWTIRRPSIRPFFRLSHLSPTAGYGRYRKWGARLIAMAHYAEAFYVEPGHCFRFVHSGVGHAKHCP